MGDLPSVKGKGGAALLTRQLPSVAGDWILQIVAEFTPD
jgi:hypothetical protein